MTLATLAAENTALRQHLWALIEAVEKENRTFLSPTKTHPMSLNVRGRLLEAKALHDD